MYNLLSLLRISSWRGDRNLPCYVNVPLRVCEWKGPGPEKGERSNVPEPEEREGQKDHASSSESGKCSVSVVHLREEIVIIVRSKNAQEGQRDC